MSNIVVDDTSPSFTYSGSWTLFTGGSSRQWNSTVHSTFQYGATVSFQFRGSVCKVYGTVPPSGNSSTVLMDVTIDGSVSPIVSQTSGSTATYADLFYQSSAMESTWHTVIITNRGTTGNLDFEFDRVELDAEDILPTISAVPSATAVTSLTPTATSQGSSSSSHPVSVGIIIGVVGGILALLIILFLLFLYRRRQKTKNIRFALISSDNAAQNMSTTVVTPFTLEPSSPSPADLNAASRLPLSSAISEKALRQQPHANRSENDLVASSTATLTLSSPSNAPASLVSVPSTNATGSLSNVEAQRPSINLPPLSESLISSAPRGPPEPNRTDTNNDSGHLLRYLPESTVTTTMHDVPPAYQPNDSE